MATYEGHWQLNDPIIQPGSVVVRAKCGHLVLLSPQGQAALAAGEFNTMCDVCHLRSGMPADAKVAMVPGAIEAAYSHVPPALHYLLRQNMRRLGVNTDDENGTA